MIELTWRDLRWFGLAAWIMAALGATFVLWFQSAAPDIWCGIGDSDFGEGHWQLWPLGLRCSYDAEQQARYGVSAIDEPGWGLTIAVIALIVVGAGYLWMQRRYRRRTNPDPAAG